MIPLTKIRDLNLSAAASADRPLHVSAASGLVCLKSFIYVIADDELHLAVFRTGGREPGHLIRMFDGALPASKSDRKRQKPDCEALILLPASRDYPDGALLALGSGSRRNRRMGALLGLDVHGAIHGSPRVVDFSPLFAPLEEEFRALNIEGAVVCGDELRLFQRGNARHAGNAIVGFDLSALLGMLSSGRTGPIRPSMIRPVDLGQVNEIPFGFTDAAALAGGRIVFTAVAEDTDNPYDDGRCVGAAVGLLGDDGRLLRLSPLDQPYKVEGVCARMDGDVLHLSLVTDADDADIASGLFSARMELGAPEA